MRDPQEVTAAGKPGGHAKPAIGSLLTLILGGSASPGGKSWCCLDRWRRIAGGESHTRLGVCPEEKRNAARVPKNTDHQKVALLTATLTMLRASSPMTRTASLRSQLFKPLGDPYLDQRLPRDSQPVCFAIEGFHHPGRKVHIDAPHVL